MSFINVRNLVKSYDTGVTALADVSIECDRGERLAVVGPSGCGKSTLLNVLAGIDTPTAGSIRVDGEPPGIADLRVSAVFQPDTVLPWKTALANVAFPLRLQGLPKADAERRAQAELAAVGLADFSNAWPRTLSGGMRRRVDLARTFAMDPDLVLLDEPFASIDPLTRLELYDLLLASLHKQGTTSVLVSHDIDEALLCSDRVIVLTQLPGKIKAVVDVPLSWPRTSSTRLSLTFHELRVAVSEALGLRAEIQSGPERMHP